MSLLSCCTFERSELTREIDQPTYHHLHIHVVNVALDPGATQAVGKAMDLGLVISILDNLPEGKGMVDLELGYTVGEGSELWKTVWEPLLREGGESTG